MHLKICDKNIWKMLSCHLYNNFGHCLKRVKNWGYSIIMSSVSLIVIFTHVLLKLFLVQDELGFTSPLWIPSFLISLMEKTELSYNEIYMYYGTSIMDEMKDCAKKSDVLWHTLYLSFLRHFYLSGFRLILLWKGCHPPRSCYLFWPIQGIIDNISVNFPLFFVMIFFIIIYLFCYHYLLSMIIFDFCKLCNLLGAISLMLRVFDDILISLIPCSVIYFLYYLYVLFWNCLR